MFFFRRAPLALLFALSSFAAAQTPGDPVYNTTFEDAVTGDNDYIDSGNRYWYIDPGADSYQNDFYERPTVQTYQTNGPHFSANEYFEFLDITHASIGFDDTWLYVSIDLFGLNKSTTDGTDTFVGLKERYGFRIGGDPDGAFSYLFVVDQPDSRGGDLSVFSPLKTFGYYDEDGDVGGSGISITKEDNPGEETGMNGYETQIISDGEMDEVAILFSRIDPSDNTVVELALNYGALGFSAEDLLNLGYVEFEANKGGPKDPQNYLWNDKYNKSEAGSPYAGTGGLSEFGTQGLGNIYELDTLRGGAPIPEPATVTALALGAAALLRRRRKNG